MNKPTSSLQGIPELIARFEAIARRQDEALLSLDMRPYNRLYKEMEVVRAELKSGPGDQRRALAPLLKSDNAQVRLKAAISVLAFMRQAACQVLLELREDKLLPQCTDAGMILRGLEDGTFVPD